MVLSTARPMKHPKSGIFWLRVRVPKDLKSIIGKTEIKKSLGTRDPLVAKSLHAKRMVEITEQFAGLRKGIQTITKKDAVAIAGLFYRRVLKEYEDKRENYTRVRMMQFRALVRLSKEELAQPQNRILGYVREHYRKDLRNFLVSEGRVVNPEQEDMILDEVNKAVVQALPIVDRNNQGDYRPDPDAVRFPEYIPPSTPGVDYSPIGVFDAYADEAKLKASTIKRWRPVIAKVQAEVPDIRELTPKWCLEWKNTLVKTDLARRTIRDIYLAALKALCNYAAENLMIETNPVDKIKVRGKDEARLRTVKGYTYEEAKVVLSASLEEQNARLPVDRRASRRWCPWVCYYSGARIGEITQLRKPDVFRSEGIWVMKITPEAGGVKTDQVRLVAIHPHLIEQGFLDFVRECSTETLFFDPARSRGGKEGNPTSKKTGERLARWVRELGIVDKELQPNHGWRHRFKTLARRALMKDEVRDYLQGHVPGTEGAKYGDFPPPLLYHEICKIPYFSFDRPDVTLADLEIDAVEEAAKDAKRAA